jgi:hypothetical protein
MVVITEMRASVTKKIAHQRDKKTDGTNLGSTDNFRMPSKLSSDDRMYNEYCDRGGPSFDLYENDDYNFS